MPDVSSFTELQMDCKVWRESNFPGDASSLSMQTLGVAEETGELCHHVLKMAQNIRGSQEYHIGQAADAVGDIIIYLTGVCDELGVGLHECVNKAWSEVRDRDWVNNPNDGT